MTHEELLQAFEDGTLAAEAFPHVEHVRLAWIHHRHRPFAEAAQAFAAGLRRFAERKGVPGLYHETITWAYLVLVGQRMAASGHESWEDFAARNPDLLEGKLASLKPYYREETLRSDLARKVFVLPDAGLPYPTS